MSIPNTFLMECQKILREMSFFKAKGLKGKGLKGCMQVLILFVQG